MSLRPGILDRYILRRTLGTMCRVLAVVMSLMLLEHVPRLLEITRLSGQRGYIVAQTVAGLLPEYGGIGLSVGLFLGIALTVRKLALGGELDVIAACGIAPLRWMRSPLIVAAMVSILTILNQGWLMPAGEARLAEIGRRMERGEFGHRLEPGEFIHLGPGRVLLFEQVDAVNGELVGLFLRAEGKTFTARRGRFWQLPTGAAVAELRDGQVIQERPHRVLDFARLQYRSDDVGGASKIGSGDRSPKLVDIGLLWADGTSSSRSAIYGRCLSAALILFLPSLALALGKPPRRQSGAVGILAGLILLVLGLKVITPLIDGHAREPEMMAAGILVAWGLFVSGLTRAEKVFGQGFVDHWASRILQNFRRPKPGSC
jgi:lipopolysaccharide export system permease protein